ncbi:MAG TPA: C25 family cysteine peptidase [bacterium]|nr:C25 family cysteine peptidase [bacterium]
MWHATKTFILIVGLLFVFAGCTPGDGEALTAAQLQSELDDFSQHSQEPAAYEKEMLRTGSKMITEPEGGSPSQELTRRQLIVVGAEEALAAVEPLLARRWKDGFAIDTGALETIYTTMPGKNRPQRLRAFLRDTADAQAQTYVLLIGSHDTIPYVWFVTDPSDPYEYGVYTDGYYANLHDDFDTDRDGKLGEWGQDEYDLVRDVRLGRVPLDDPEHVAAWAARVLAYEKDFSARMDDALLAGGYISTPGDTAIIVSMIREMVLKPGGYGVTTMLEEHPYGDAYNFLSSDRPLNKDEFTDELSNDDYGFVFWMSHGSSSGASTLSHGSFITTYSMGYLKSRRPTMFFSSACLQLYPDYGANIGEEIMKQNAVSFVGSLGETYPHNLGGGSLIFMTAMNKTVVQGLPLAQAIDESRDVYIDVFWKLPYPRGVYLKNFFGFTVLGDPTMTYPGRR